jgi:exopolysaccharide biosynthesis WecB/TagA/CpsF family protein
MIANWPSENPIELPAKDGALPSPLFSPKSDLCGIAYSPATFQQLYGTICRWLCGDRSKGAIIGYVNPHVFNLAMKHEAVRAFLEQADIVAVDGLGVSLALWLLKGERQSRTVMTPLFDQVLETADLPRLLAALIGGTEDVARKGAAAMNRVSRKIQVVAVAHGYQPLPRYEDFLRDHEAIDLVLVAMGSPRSEEFIGKASQLFPGKLFWNIGGGTLHFHAGTQPRVPKIISTLGTQWLWRMVLEPQIVPRYVVGIPVFASHLLQAGRAAKMKGTCL